MPYGEMSKSLKFLWFNESQKKGGGNYWFSNQKTDLEHWPGERICDLGQSLDLSTPTSHLSFPLSLIIHCLKIKLENVNLFDRICLTKVNLFDTKRITSKFHFSFPNANQDT